MDKVRLHHGCEGHAWVDRRWPEFAGLAKREMAPLVILPVTGLASWGADLPLNAEETVTMAVLDGALRELGAASPALVIPPWPFVFAPDPATGFFGVDPETAHAWLDEVCTSIQASGLTRILFLNGSPANADVLDVAGRDLRIARGLQVFCINLDGLGLGPAETPLGEGENGFARLARALSAAGENARTDPVAAALLEPAARHLARLLREIQARPPLPQDGQIPSKTAFSGSFPRAT